jgi:hypothetical protein
MIVKMIRKICKIKKIMLNHKDHRIIAKTVGEFHKVHNNQYNKIKFKSLPHNLYNPNFNHYPGSRLSTLSPKALIITAKTNKRSHTQIYFPNCYRRMNNYRNLRKPLWNSSSSPLLKCNKLPKPSRNSNNK